MRVTASKTGLLAQCGYWARPDAEVSADVPGPAAERGTRFHAAIAAYVETGVTAAVYDEDIGPLVAEAARWVEDFGRLNLTPEVAFAWAPETDTAERLASKDRDYSAGKGRLCGTADLIAIVRSARVGYVADWKTGSGEKAGPQLRTLALMLARAEDLDSVTVEALEVTAAGVRSVCREELDTFALAGIAEELAGQLASVETASPVPGAHCGELYCPARAVCPEGRAAIDALIPAEALVTRPGYTFSSTIQSGDHAAWMLDRLRLVVAAADAIKDAIKAAAPEGGWTLQDGSQLRETTSSVRAFDKGTAQALLRELGATDEQIETCWYEFSRSNGLRTVKAKGRRAA